VVWAILSVPLRALRIAPDLRKRRGLSVCEDKSIRGIRTSRLLVPLTQQIAIAPPGANAARVETATPADGVDGPAEVVQEWFRWRPMARRFLLA
jgi:hypothetical protein